MREPCPAAEGAFALIGGVLSLAGALVGQWDELRPPPEIQPTSALNDATTSDSANRIADQPFQVGGSDVLQPAKSR